MRVVRYYPRALAGDGGITASVQSSSRAMAALGVDVVIVYEGVGTSGRGSFVDGVEYVPLRHRGPAGIRVPVGMEGVLAPGDVLVLHSGWTAHNLAASAAARRVAVPYVLEPRGAYDPHIVVRRKLMKSAWWTLAERRMVEHSAAVHMFFDSELGHLRRLGYEGPTVTAPNGVRVPAAHRWDGGSGGYLMWLGRFDPEHKGLDLLLRAMQMLPPPRRPDLRLHGPDWRGKKEGVRQMVASLGLGRYVKVERPLLGEAKYAAMSQARAFVYPSRWEAFGNSVAEASAVGLPVLTTRYPLGCYLDARSAGIAKEATARSLADGIEEVLHPGAAEMGARAQQVAGSEFRWENIARAWVDQVGTLI